MLKEVSSRRDLKSFLYFPFWLYAHDALWQPANVAVEKYFLRRKSNPFYQYGDAKLFLVMKDRRVAGRVAVFANHHELEGAQKTMRIGFLDYENDKAVFAELMQAIADAAAEVGANRLIVGETFVNGLVGFNSREINKFSKIDHYKPDYVFRQLQNYGFDILNENPTAIFTTSKTKINQGISEIKKLNATEKHTALQQWLQIAPETAQFLAQRFFKNQFEIFQTPEIGFCILPEKQRVVGIARVLKSHNTNKKRMLAHVFGNLSNPEMVGSALADLLLVLAQQGATSVKISGFSTAQLANLQTDFSPEIAQDVVVYGKDLA